LQLEDLYLVDGAYRYQSGWKWRAVAATAIGCALAWGGLVVPVLGRLYDYTWFVGLLVSGVVYWMLSGSTTAHAARLPIAEMKR
jgi:NCS1 family nucleobase:cation symporter-1